MSTTRKSMVFLMLAFAISWAIAVGAHVAGLKETVPPTLILAVMMTGPAIAALVCAFAFEKGRRAEALGLRFKPNQWWLYAWLIPIVLAAMSVIVTLLLTDQRYVEVGVLARQAAEAQGQDLSQAPAFMFSTWLIVGASITLGALINAPILTFTEELGWRGYLHDLWRPSGFWRASLGTGLVWGAWHAPAILFYGVNYPDNTLIGMGLFTGFCMLLSPIMTLVRDRAGSVWAAGILHGTFNAVGGLTIGMLSEPAFPWNGIIGVGGFIAIAIGAALVALAQRQPQVRAEAAGA